MSTVTAVNKKGVSAQELAALVVEALNLEDTDPTQMDPAAPLFGDGLGLDSLDMLEIALVIQQRYGVKLKTDDPANETIYASLQSLAEHISRLQAQA
ncbi:MAG: phosphopantetheine-binding protein [Burkholderiaceae bacterium]|jgi:acyl carrier protein|nr:phosphopantetheine-binding protein [Burkholderiaceae bacterium]